MKKQNKVQIGKLIYSYKTPGYTDNKVELRRIDSSRLVYLINNSTIIPAKCQRSLDQNRVLDLKKLSSDDLETLPFYTPPIQLGYNNNKYYIVDGQHRCQLFKELFEEKGISHQTLITIQNIEDNDELNKWFYSINKENFNLAVDPKELLIPKELRVYSVFREKILEHFDKKCFPSKDCMHIYFIDDLIKEMRKRNIYEINKIDNAYDYVNFIITKNDEFMRKAKYEELMSYAPDLIFYKKEQTNINYGCILNIKRNNFLDFLENNDETFICTHTPRYYRKKICNSKKNILWNKSKGKCYICGINIDKNTFEAAHVEPFCESGNDNIDNLRPSCKNCNREMGTTNLYEYKRKRMEMLIKQQNMRKEMENLFLSNLENYNNKICNNISLG
jgi:hypothetical protein